MDTVEVAAATALILKCKRGKKRKSNRRLWLGPMSNQRLLTGKFQKFFSEIRSSEFKFSNYFQMSVECFDKLLKAVGPRIQHENTILRKAIPPEERLAVTLRFLSTGSTLQMLQCEYLLGQSTMSEIIRDTCPAIWDCLVGEYMPTVNDSDTWLKMANAFYELTSFPNCIGAVGGKCIPTRKKSQDGSNISTLLMAVSDASYSFVAIEVVTHDESYARSLLFEKSQFGLLLKNGELNIPGPRPLPNDEEGTPMPFVLAGDMTFAPCENVLRPYLRSDQLRFMPEQRRTFNLRLSRANRVVECCFASVAKKWKILRKTFEVRIELCSSIVRAACILHNFVLKQEGIEFEDTLYESPLQCLKVACNKGGQRRMKTREYFAQYFASPRGSVPWQ